MQPSVWKAQSLFPDNDAKETLHRLARIIYAESGASSLRSVEALASMTMNLCATTGRPLPEIIFDKSIFESLYENSARHQDLFANKECPGFQMCMRVAKRAAAGALPDAASGATRFHSADNMPRWAVSEGYIAEIDGLFFYK